MLNLLEAVRSNALINRLEIGDFLRRLTDGLKTVGPFG